MLQFTTLRTLSFSALACSSNVTWLYSQRWQKFEHCLLLALSMSLLLSLVHCPTLCWVIEHASSSSSSDVMQGGRIRGEILTHYQFHGNSACFDTTPSFNQPENTTVPSTIPNVLHRLLSSSAAFDGDPSPQLVIRHSLLRLK